MTGTAVVPVSEEQVQVLAQLAGLRIAPEHMPGVIRSLGILLGEAQVLGQISIVAAIEPAAVYRP